MILLFSILLWRIFSLQIVNGKEYQDNYTFKIVKERTLNSTRGNIYDRNGNLLAYNELAYSCLLYTSTHNALFRFFTGIDINSCDICKQFIQIMNLGTSACDIDSGMDNIFCKFRWCFL